ncbi:unnamed protein product [Clonostachys rosea]|uniref:DUF7730 domain-containing protein n=1 Tax=Bionectria ochroleuca TaxID=29856 RepID=A0ABY6UWY3_BIOOC|nr:unnamed protein product [Clonostachys rosea]
MDAENEMEREERLRNLYATLAEELGYRGDNWMRAAAETVDQFFASLGDSICECIERLDRRYGPFWKLRWSLYYPCSPRNRKLRDLKRTKRQLKQICESNKTATTPWYVQLARAPFARLGRIAKGSTVNRSLFFTRLPPEIRTMILEEAFGNQTIHLDLSLRYPFHEMQGEPKLIRGRFYHFCAHAKIRPATFEHFSSDMFTVSEEGTYDTTKSKEWRWLSCVCHRQPPTAKLLPFGRRQNDHGSLIHEPHGDRCLDGRGYCPMWPGAWPSKCSVGVYGWLLSCRQAYMETQQILFRSNTFHISSPALLLGIQDVMSSNVIGMMTSLDIVFDRGVVELAKAFTSLPSRFGIKSIHEAGKITFPSMQQLRISFVEISQFTDPWTGDYTTDTDHRNRNVMTLGTLPKLDALVQRIVPPSAEVTVSCPRSHWYSEIENALIAQQGHPRTQSQPSELGGQRCWREIPNIDRGTQVIANSSVEALLDDTLIAGYWIHSSQGRPVQGTEN